MQTDSETMPTVMRHGSRVIAQFGSQRRVMDPVMTMRRRRYLLRLIERAVKEGKAVVSPWCCGLPGPLMSVAKAMAYATDLERTACGLENETLPDLIVDYRE